MTSRLPARPTAPTGYLGPSPALALLLSLVAVLGSTSAGCLGCSSAEPQAAARLRTEFPTQATRLLDGEHAFVASSDAFALQDAAGAATPRGLGMRLPRNGNEAIAIHAGELAVSVHEVGADGEGAIAGSAVVYALRDRTSIWTATPGGVEEWLLLDAGTVHGNQAAAAWDVEGGSVRQSGDGAEIVDASGAARIRVTAPVAYAKGGRVVPVRIEVRGARIEIVVDADGEEVLVDPSWTSAGSLTGARYVHTATRLTSGKVLVTGGFDTAMTALATAELYDPALNLWAPATSMSTPRAYHVAALLPNGKVLVAGGTSNAGFLSSAELYDPATNLWSAAPGLSTVRYYPTATVLTSGKVLVAGGYHDNASAELYDPAANAWSPAGAMSTGRYHHKATLLANGKVLVEGGIGTGQVYAASADLYDPATNAWSAAGKMAAARADHSATLLPSGKVLVAGDYEAFSLASAELYDPATNTWSAAASMAAARGYHSATLFPNGKVLVAGGYSGGQLASVEVYTPATNAWAAGPSMATARDGHSATLLQNGRLLIAAGNGTAGALKAAELFSFGDPGDACASGTDCVSGFCASGVCCNSACNGGTCSACSVAAGADTDGICKLVSGKACDDGNACTATSTCVAGVCTGGSPVTCAAMDACHVAGVCSPATGMCSNPSGADGTVCNDNDACTATSACKAGVCTGASPVTCLAMDQCHTAGVCNPATGMCPNPAKADGAACDDKDACTAVDTCVAGVCTGAKPVVCAAMDECHDVGSCDSAKGTCSNPAKADGTVCALGTCQAGICTVIPDGGTGASTGAGGGGTGGTTATGTSTATGAGGTTVSSSTSTGSANGSTGTGVVTPAKDGGCGCRTAATRGAGEDAFGGLALALALAFRRRTGRRREAASQR